MNFKGIITKLEFKAMLYISGLSKNQIIDIINMQDYFSITYINSRNQAVKTEVEKINIYDVIKHHSKSLLILN